MQPQFIDEKPRIEKLSTKIKLPIQENKVSLAHLANLFDALNREGVRYCHWKSNIRLEKAVTGRTDLDLLIDRRHSQLFRRIVIEHNIKPIMSAPGKHYPSIESYLGFDQASGRLFHLHVHYQLVLGEQFVKNYRLPLEEHLLESVQLRHGVPIPQPELELIILSIRALLKYRDRDALKDLLSIRTAGLPADILKEITWLLRQTSMDRISHELAKLGDIVPKDVVLEFLHTVVDNPRNGYRLYTLRARLRKALQPFQRHRRTKASMIYFLQLLRKQRSFRKFLPSQRMTSFNGGLTLALIGADGSGKSTMTQLLYQWLSWKLDVHLFYMGSKQPSRRSKLLYIFFRMARRGHRDVCQLLGEKNPVAWLLDVLLRTMQYCHHLSIGYDRYLRYKLSRQKAMDGSVVIFDRFPLEAPLDGPKIHLTSQGKIGWLTRVFSKVERNIYARLRQPDHFFVLDVSPNVSLQRKPDHDRSAIEAKSKMVRTLVNSANQPDSRANITRIDADLPSDTVLSQLKTLIWEIL